MKKLTAIFVCLLLVASLAVTALAAAPIEMTLATANASVTRGATVELTVSIPEVANLRSGSAALDFDTDVLEFVGGSCPLVGTMLGDVNYNNNIANGVFTYKKNEVPASISGLLFTFNLKVKDAAAFGKTTVTMSTGSLKDKDGNVLDITLGSVELEVVCAAHTEETKVTKEATCKEEGEKVTTCTECGATIKTEKIEKLPHTEETKTTKEATCKEAGEKVTSCKVCGETIKTEAIAKLPHTEETKVTKEATCSAEGEKVTTCTACSETLKTEKIEKLPHDNETKVTKEATCSAEGEQTVTCKVCGESKTEKIEKLAHTMDAGVETKAPTCSAAGEKTYTCSVCKETEVEAIEKLAHTWDEGKVTTAATTEKEGVKTYTCTVCKEATKTEAIAKLEPAGNAGTGDNSMIIAFVALMVLSAAGIAVTVIGKKKFA